MIKGPTADAGERGGEGHVPLPEALATNESESADVRCVGNGGKVDVGEGGATEERAEAKVVRDVGNVREVRAEHPKKALSPMLVSVAGSVSSASEVHRAKAFRPMVTTPLGSTHLETELQPRKA